MKENIYKIKMELRMKADEIPSHAHRLYIKLYCERKGEKDKKTIQEAKQSWISLSLSKKKYFYKTSADRNLLKYAHGICKTETYLKEKLPTKHENRLDRPKSIGDQYEKIDPHANESNLMENGISQPVAGNQKNNPKLEVTSKTQSNPDNNQEANVDNSLCDPTPLTEINKTSLEDILDTQSNTDSNQESIVIPLDEPAPPTVKIGKDLYEMIKGPGVKDWKDITKKEKNHYNSAVRALKREYIKNYTKYLESLPQQQLFDHYMKTLH